ncbi:MAG: site-specific DNA-methyltransferase, partial [Anaerolineae bacterium]
MAAIDDLITQIEDGALRDRLREEVDRLTKEKKFGLVFEEHLPELTPIFAAPIRPGSRVARRDAPLTDVWRVLTVEGDRALCLNHTTGDQRWMPTADLVVVRRFGEPIFPALTPIDRVQHGPDDAPWHTLIEADNYHALQLLEYLYAGQVDCIYIDPPYNTGARDWKYNNNYVDANDRWRH